MDKKLRQDAERIVSESIRAVLPDEAVRRALADYHSEGKTVLIAAGKAAWQMAKAASDMLDGIDGVVVTKYDHVKGDIPNVICCEAGHPVPDENGFRATEKALELVTGLSERDTVLFLLSGGGSALFEKPLISGEELRDVTSSLLASGADIVEMNTIRKRLSAVKGGRFALACAPAKVFSIAWALLDEETPKALTNVETRITGSVRELCAAAAKECAALGYEPLLLTDRLCCEAREAGSFLASILQSHASSERSLAFIAGGETVVHLTGSGLGGRNQELALSAAQGIAGLSGAAVFSVGSDGTDGPTDAAGGYADADTVEALTAAGQDVFDALRRNDAYRALKAANGLIVTGPTGTNVNDVAVALLKRS